MVALLREQLADMRQQRDHWQNEVSDWKRQAQNPIAAAATGSATSGNLGKPARNRACNNRQPPEAHLALAALDRVRAQRCSEPGCDVSMG
jgi:hypothetical protein